MRRDGEGVCGVNPKKTKDPGGCAGEAEDGGYGCFSGVKMLRREEKERF